MVLVSPFYYKSGLDHYPSMFASRRTGFLDIATAKLSATQFLQAIRPLNLRVIKLHPCPTLESLNPSPESQSRPTETQTVQAVNVMKQRN